MFKGVLCDFNLGENFLNPALEKASLDKAIFDVFNFIFDSNFFIEINLIIF